MVSPNQPSESSGHRFQRRGFSFERAIRLFFASNAGLTIFILLLIIVFLLREGLGFFHGYRRELEVYRIAGLEFVDISRKNLSAHEQVTSLLNRAYQAEINGKCLAELRRSQEASALYNSFNDKVGPTRDLILNNPAATTGGDAGMLAVLRTNYEAQRAKALTNLPPAPHLSVAERQEFIDSLRNRPAEATYEPPLVAKLNAEFAAARQMHAEPLQHFRETIDNFESAGMDLGSIVMEMTESVTATKEALQTADILEKDRKTLLAAAANAKDPIEREKLIADAKAALAEKPDVEGPMATLMEKKPDCVKVHEQLVTSIGEIFPNLPGSLTQANASRYLNAAKAAWPVLISDLKATPAKISSWTHTDPVPLSAAFISFLTGKSWVTGGEWQDFYGIIPLAVGSLMIAIVALAIAIPVGIGAAIYVNQFAAPREQALVKPVIEFIQAIPSVVL